MIHLRALRLLRSWGSKETHLRYKCSWHVVPSRQFHVLAGAIHIMFGIQDREMGPRNGTEHLRDFVVLAFILNAEGLQMLVAT